MTAENTKIKKRILNDMERGYELTMSDIARYKRQAGSINVEVIKRLIRWNYFRNEDAVDFYYYEDKNVNKIIVAMDMFDLELWITENYGIEIEELEGIKNELSFLAIFCINK